MKVLIANRAISQKERKRAKRKLRIRGKISGNIIRPRVSVFRSNKNLYVQVIDDTQGVTLAFVSTYEEKFKSLAPTVESAKTLGLALGDRLLEKKIPQVVFDRNGYKYHGVLKALVDGIREKGIKV